MALSKVKRIERLIERINELPASFRVHWLGACRESRIARVERILGVSFPNTYRQLVRSKGGGGIESFFILGVPPKGPIDEGGACGCMAEYFREDWVAKPLPQHFVPVQSDQDLIDPFCLDTSRMKRGECPVVLYFLANGIVEEVAPDFVTFYEKYIDEFTAGQNGG